MTQTDTIRIMPLNDSPRQLKKVKSLGDSQSSTLGFLPSAAFDDYARKNTILIALDQRDELCGYLLYRISEQTVTIVHLCIDPKSRGLGIATQLVEELKSISLPYRGIGLRCRRDYDLQGLWSKLDFVPKSERPGRKIGGSILIHWWYDNHHPNLFSEIASQTDSIRPLAVLDANIFFDIFDPASPTHIECQALLANWLEDFVAFAITDELYNEIQRQEDDQLRRVSRQRISEFRVLTNHRFDRDQISLKLSEILTAPTTDSEESDQKQLLYAIEADANYFVTYDTKLLEYGNEIEDQFGIHILKPVELIRGVDQASNQSLYDPSRFGGTLMQRKLIDRSDMSDLRQHFQNYRSKETTSAFNALFNKALSDPQKNQCFLILSRENTKLAVMLLAHDTESFLRVHAVRVHGQKEQSTLALQLVKYSIELGRRSGATAIIVDDPYPSQELVRALEYFGFCRGDGHSYSRLIVTEQATPTNLMVHISNLSGSIPHLGKTCEEVLPRLSLLAERPLPDHAAEMERQLWPSKILGCGIGCYVVPIRPYWALHLFDEELSNETIFGAKESVALRVENAYYRAATPKVLSAPGRILWYVSNRQGYSKSKSIVASSFLDEVIIDTPKPLYRNLKRLGIYEWKHVSQLVHGDIKMRLMGFRFSGTELFNRPVPLTDIVSIIKAHTKKSCTFQSPFQIPEGAFFQLYHRGNGKP